MQGGWFKPMLVIAGGIILAGLVVGIVARLAG